MNKQELVEKYVYMKRNLEMWVCTSNVLEDLKQLDEPQKTVVPPFVADYIKYAIENDWDLQDLFKYIEDEEDEKLLRWVYHERNQETLAAAWINGYTVEKEKRYLVKMKGVTRYGRYLNKILSSGEYFLASENEVDGYKTKHTRKELENSGFGWVFNCPGIEVEEVKE